MTAVEIRPISPRVFGYGKSKSVGVKSKSVGLKSKSTGGKSKSTGGMNKSTGGMNKSTGRNSKSTGRSTGRTSKSTISKSTIRKSSSTITSNSLGKNTTSRIRGSGGGNRHNISNDWLTPRATKLLWDAAQLETGKRGAVTKGMYINGELKVAGRKALTVLRETPCVRCTKSGRTCIVRDVAEKLVTSQHCGWCIRLSASCTSAV